MARELLPIDIERIFLYEENPRHEPLANEDEVIAYLCKDEQVFNLARSISEAGTNPLALLGVVQLPGSGRASTKKTYQAWEGNRRVCAIKLLNDPDRAPPNLRKDFARLGFAPCLGRAVERWATPSPIAHVIRKSRAPRRLRLTY